MGSASHANRSHAEDGGASYRVFHRSVELVPDDAFDDLVETEGQREGREHELAPVPYQGKGRHPDAGEGDPAHDAGAGAEAHETSQTTQMVDEPSFGSRLEEAKHLCLLFYRDARRDARRRSSSLALVRRSNRDKIGSLCSDDGYLPRNGAFRAA